MDKKVLNTIIALALVIGFFAGALGGGLASFVLFRASGIPPAAWRMPPPSQPATGWKSTEVAAANSVEGKLRTEGKHWTRTTGGFAVGAYVEDIYEGRMNQPHGRGAIGKILSLGSDPNNGNPGATVDFGRGFVVGINLSELSLVQVNP
jgi:hypothetical protein